MSHQRPDPEASGNPQMERGLGVALVLLVRGLCATVEVFLHKPESFGERWAGLQVIVGFLLMLAYPVVFWPGHDPAPLYGFLGAYTAMLMWVRLRTFVRHRCGGLLPHSQYSGTPRLLRLLPRFKEETILCVVEPLLVVVMGGVVTEFNDPLGCYLLIAGFAMLASSNLNASEQAHRARRMRDARIDQQALVQTFRERHGG